MNPNNLQNSFYEVVDSAFPDSEHENPLSRVVRDIIVSGVTSGATLALASLLGYNSKTLRSSVAVSAAFYVANRALQRMNAEKELEQQGYEEPI